MREEDVMAEALAALSRQHFGKYRGRVAGNEDETGRGRLLVSVPAVLGDEQVWALPCVPYAGQDVGFYAMPEVGTGVWVEFEAGDLSYPIWTGCFWADGQIARRDARPHVKFLRTEQVSLRIDDREGTLEIAVNGGAMLRLSVTELKQQANQVISEAGGKRIALTPLHFDLHDGAFTVV